MRQVLSIGMMICSLAGFATGGYLSVKGNALIDESGTVVRLTGVNWFGFETSNCSPHGLWARDYKGLLNQIREMGFNCVRIPWCNKIMQPGVKPSSISFHGSDPFRTDGADGINAELEGKTSLEILDEIIKECGVLGLAVILDNHSREPDGYMNEKVWYTASCSDRQWIEDWVTLARRYAGNSTVVGCDLNNEPHGKISDGGAQWGTGDEAFDWRLAAQRCGNAILEVNPDVLIIVEGVEQVGSTSYWWGGNLTGVKDHPVQLTVPGKLVYSPHEYGPEVHQQVWFDDPAFPDNMEQIWDNAFGYLYRLNTAPLLIGEFGIRDAEAYEGRALTWFKKFLEYMAGCYSWTFWCLNPNSGDTGGLFTHDWLTVEQWKLDLLKPYMAPLLGASTAVRPSRVPAAGISAVQVTPGAASGMMVHSLDGRRIGALRDCRHLPAGAYLLVDLQTGSARRVTDVHSMTSLRSR